MDWSSWILGGVLAGREVGPTEEPGPPRVRLAVGPILPPPGAACMQKGREVSRNKMHELGRRAGASSTPGFLPVLGKPHKEPAAPTPILSHESIPNTITEEVCWCIFNATDIN